MRELVQSRQSSIVALMISTTLLVLYFLANDHGFPIQLNSALAGSGIVAYGYLHRWNVSALGFTVHPLQGWSYWTRIALFGGGIVLAGYVVGEMALRQSTHIFPALWEEWQMSEVRLWRWFYIGVVAAPLIEEIMFRLLVCVPLLSLIGTPYTILISGVLFAAVHFVYGVPSPDNQIGGFLFAWAFCKSRSLLVPILLHAGGNAVTLLVRVVATYA